MKKVFSLLLCLFSMINCWSQEQEIKMVIDKMFASMYARDTVSLRECFIPAAQLMTYTYDAKGNPRSKAETINHFISGITSVGEAEIEERLTGWQCLIDEGMASVWTPYEFYFENKFSHCGVNSFQMLKVQGQWKITQLSDTRRRTDCVTDQKTVMMIDSTINLWHHAAAVADEDTFFGGMTEDGIYIGTDATERWLRDELAVWSKQYFDRETAWSFVPLSRNVTIGPGGHIAWFDELLDTWMGVCRSTGIVIKSDQGWKITHYQLSITLPNEKIDGFKKLIGKD